MMHGTISERVPLEQLPGGDLIRQGIADLREGKETLNSLLIEICAPVLERNGWPVSRAVDNEVEAERRLYQSLRNDGQGNPYGRYNGYLKMLTSFGRALEHRRMGRQQVSDSIE